MKPKKECKDCIEAESNNPEHPKCNYHQGYFNCLDDVEGLLNEHILKWNSYKEPTIDDYVDELKQRLAKLREKA